LVPGKEDAVSIRGSTLAGPTEMLASTALTTQEKINILRLWAYDVAEMAVAVEEGMPDIGSNDLQRQIFLALEALGVDLHTTAPTKQHGLNSPAAQLHGRDAQDDS
jgi:hypothetical protein